MGLLIVSLLTMLHCQDQKQPASLPSIASFRFAMGWFWIKRYQKGSLEKKSI